MRREEKFCRVFFWENFCRAFWGFWQSILGKRIFIEEESKEGDGVGREENWRRGLTPGEKLH